jgi:hypothetical protein
MGEKVGLAESGIAYGEKKQAYERTFDHDKRGNGL